MKKFTLYLVTAGLLFLAVQIHPDPIQPSSLDAAPNIQITYELKGGTNSILNRETLTAEELPFTLQIPYRKGYNFSGWYLEDTYRNKVEILTEYKDITLYAKWTLMIDSVANINSYPYESTRREDVLLLKDLPYQLFDKIDTPGNPKTRWVDLQNHYIDSENQCPQGLCLTPEYVLITTYHAGKEDALGALIFYDRKTGEHVKSFGMEAGSHVGGITFDGENIWICHSNTREVERISYDFLKHLIRVSKQNFIDISKCFSRYQVKNSPSCISYENGRIYVATHKIYTTSCMVAYCYDKEKDQLVAEDSFFIPSRVQGVVWDEQGHVIFSTSYGRSSSSYLYIYDSMEDLRHLFQNPILTVELPPGSEELVLSDDELYLLFETSCYKYYEGTDGKGTCEYPIDQIVILDLTSVFFD